MRPAPLRPITISEQIEAQFAVILTRYYAELIRSTPLEENRPHLLGGTSAIRKDPIGISRTPAHHSAG